MSIYAQYAGNLSAKNNFRDIFTIICVHFRLSFRGNQITIYKKGFLCVRCVYSGTTASCYLSLPNYQPSQLGKVVDHCTGIDLVDVDAVVVAVGGAHCLEGCRTGGSNIVYRATLGTVCKEKVLRV